MSFADEIEDWLADGIPGHVDRIIDIAQLSGRERRLTSRLRVPTGQRHEFTDTERFDYVEVDGSAPGDLRAIADAHEAAAAGLTQHAAELREYADDLEHGSDRGVRLVEHFRVMREEREHRSAEFNHAWSVSGAEDGVRSRFSDRAKFGDLGSTLMHAGLLTVDDVREALLDGRLLRVKGIGPARFSLIAQELQREEAA